MPFDHFDPVRWTVYLILGPPALLAFFLIPSGYWRILALLAVLVFIEETMLTPRLFYVVGASLTGALAYSMFASFVLRPSIRQRMSGIGLAWGALLFFGLCGVVIGFLNSDLGIPRNLFMWQIYYVEALLFFLLGRCAFDEPEQVVKAMTFVVFLGTGAAAIQLFSLATGITFYHAEIQEGMVDATSQSYRHGGLFHNPNRLADFCVMMVPVALLLRLERRDLSTLVSLGLVVGIVLMTTATILTASRGALLVLPMVLLAALLISRIELRTTVALAAVGIIVLPLIGWLMTAVFPAYFDRVVDRFTAAGLQTSRFQLWAFTLELLLKNPLGVGQHPQSFYQLALQQGIPLGNPHSIYLHVAVQAGIPGLIAFLVIVGSVMRRAWLARSLGTGALRLAGALLFLAVLGFMLSGISHHLFTNTKIQRIFWIMAGAASFLPAWLPQARLGRNPSREQVPLATREPLST